MNILNPSSFNQLMEEGIDNLNLDDILPTAEMLESVQMWEIDLNED